jgi:hypothetical protein
MPKRIKCKRIPAGFGRKTDHDLAHFSAFKLNEFSFILLGNLLLFFALLFLLVLERII